MVHHLTLLCHAMQCHTTFWFPRLPCWLSCGPEAAVTKPWAPHVFFLENKGKGILIATLLPVLGLQIYYTIVMVYFFSSKLTSLLMLSSLISLFSCYCSGCHSLLYVSQASWPSLCLIPSTSFQLWCPGCMSAGFTSDTSKGTHWLDLGVIQVMTSPSPVCSQLPCGKLLIPLHQQVLTYSCHFW